MVKQTITDGGFMDIAGLGIIDFEMLVGAVGVGFAFEIVVQIKDMIHQMQLKLLHILLVTLAFDKLAPRE